MSTVSKNGVCRILPGRLLPPANNTRLLTVTGAILARAWDRRAVDHCARGLASVGAAGSVVAVAVALPPISSATTRHHLIIRLGIRAPNQRDVVCMFHRQVMFAQGCGRASHRAQTIVSVTYAF